MSGTKDADGVTIGLQGADTGKFDGAPFSAAPQRPSEQPICRGWIGDDLAEIDDCVAQRRLLVTVGQRRSGGVIASN